MLKTSVLAGPVDHLTDARYFAAWEVDRLSFTLDAQAEAEMNPAKLAALREWITGPRIVGIFQLTPAEDIPAIARESDLDAIQLGPFYPVAVARSLQEAGWTVLKEIVVEGYSDAEDVAHQVREHAPLVEATILSFSKGGIDYEDLEQNMPLSVATLRHWCEQYSLLLDLNASSRSAAELLAALQPAGFAVRGGEEEQVGVKNFDELDSFFESLEVPEG
jgi:phosphoribosylanthranilate isomerase